MIKVNLNVQRMNILFGPEEKFFLLRVFALTPNICKPVIGQKIVSLDQGVRLLDSIL